jgi:hypothetical protein
LQPGEPGERILSGKIAGKPRKVLRQTIDIERDKIIFQNMSGARAHFLSFVLYFYQIM